MLQQIIIVEGHDKSGKSNIIVELSKRLNIPSYKSSSEHNNFLISQNRFKCDIEYACPARLDLIKQTKQSVIFDRAYPSEYVYSLFYNRDTNLQSLQMLDEEYAKLGAKIIICQRKNLDGIVDDLDPKLDSRALQEIAQLYDAFTSVTSCKVYKLYVDDEDLDREVNEIIDFLNK